MLRQERQIEYRGCDSDLLTLRTAATPLFLQFL
jgi:hypothetical protein